VSGHEWTLVTMFFFPAAQGGFRAGKRCCEALKEISVSQECPHTHIHPNTFNRGRVGNGGVPPSMFRKCEAETVFLNLFLKIWSG